MNPQFIHNAVSVIFNGFGTDEELCGGFDENVKSTLDSVTAASTEMRATAEGMASSAQQASEQSTAVAGATEESSANVQTVQLPSRDVVAIAGQVIGSGTCQKWTALRLPKPFVVEKEKLPILLSLR